MPRLGAGAPVRYGSFLGLQVQEIISASTVGSKDDASQGEGGVINYSEVAIVRCRAVRGVWGPVPTQRRVAWGALRPRGRRRPGRPAHVRKPFFFCPALGARLYAPSAGQTRKRSQCAPGASLFDCAQRLRKSPAQQEAICRPFNNIHAKSDLFSMHEVL